jgi:hypothetical protein
MKGQKARALRVWARTGMSHALPSTADSKARFWETTKRQPHIHIHSEIFERFMATSDRQGNQGNSLQVVFSEYGIMSSMNRGQKRSHGQMAANSSSSSIMELNPSGYMYNQDLMGQPVNNVAVEGQPINPIALVAYAPTPHSQIPHMPHMPQFPHLLHAGLPQLPHLLQYPGLPVSQLVAPRKRRPAYTVRMCNVQGCKTPAQHRNRGIPDRCGRHGGVPACSEVGCEVKVTFMKGGIRDKCSKHGGVPMCSEEGCTVSANYKKGGVRGKCGPHGGMPTCNEPACRSKIQFRAGGVKGKCAKHGGVPRCSEGGCTSVARYVKGGIQGKCKAHGAIAKCKYVDANGVQCKTASRYYKGGQRGFCGAHGGVPKCDVPECSSRVELPNTSKCKIHGSEGKEGYFCQKEGCKSLQHYRTGGKRGFCSKHGGYPSCNEPDCARYVSHQAAGVPGKCSTHGGMPVCAVEGCTARTYKEQGRSKSYVRKGEYAYCAAHANVQG